MSDSARRNASKKTPTEGAGVLAGLPRTRPQRSSPRRAAARAAAGEDTKRAPSAPARARVRPAKTSGPVSSAGAYARARTAKKTKRAIEQQVPEQGYEAEPDALGPVQPPGGAELIASAAELAGELAKTGVGAGARMLRDFLARLPG